MKNTIKRLEELIDKSSFPWTSCYKGHHVYWINDNNYNCISEIYDTPELEQDGNYYASLIAEGISAIPLLIQEIKKLQEQKETLTIKINKMIEKYECKQDIPDPIC